MSWLEITLAAALATMLLGLGLLCVDAIRWWWKP